jgi:hypothetical protein
MTLSDEDRRRIEKEEANRLALKIAGFTESYATMRMHTKDVVWTPDNEEQAQYRKLTFERLEREEPTRVREGWELKQAHDREQRERYTRSLEANRSLNAMLGDPVPIPFFTWAGLGMLLIAAFVYIAIPAFVLWVLFVLFGVK